MLFSNEGNQGSMEMAEPRAKGRKNADEPIIQRVKELVNKVRK